MDKELHCMNEKPRESHTTIRLLLEYEENVLDITYDFTLGEKIMNGVNWQREKKYDPLSRELVNLHVEIQGVSSTGKDTDCEQHLGETL